jgi:FkbM family methyltransferase
MLVADSHGSPPPGFGDAKKPVQLSRSVGTRYGPLLVPGAQDKLITRFLDEVGEWAWDEAVFLARLLPDGARVLDGGAFLGTFGLGLGMNKRLRLLCAVEANEMVLPLLEANLEQNAKAVEVITTGALLTGVDGARRPGFADPTNLGSLSYVRDRSGEAFPPSTTTTTLAALRDKYGNFDLIKLDIEGMEHEVLSADAEHLARGDTMLWIECNQNSRSLQVLDLLLSWGVSVHYFAFPSHNPNNFKRRADPILPWAYEAGFLASPKATPTLSDELASHHCILRRISSRADLEEAMWFTPRWLPSELSHAGPSELAAVASHAILGQARNAFLSDVECEECLAVCEQLAATPTTLTQAEALASARLELNHAKKLRVRLQAKLTHAEELLLTRSEQLEREIQLRSAVEKRLAKAASIALGRLEQVGEQAQRVAVAEARAIELERSLQAIQTSLSWRLIARLHKFVGNRPFLHRELRRARAVVGAVLGRR